MFYSKLVLLFIWLCISSFIGLIDTLVRPGDRRLQARCAKRISTGMLWITGIRVEAENESPLKKPGPALLIANHQSAFDIPVFGALLPPETVTVAKKEILYVPFLGLLFVLSGGIRLHRKKRDKAISQMDSAAKKLKDKKRWVIVMPEGTRNRSRQGLLPFKKGAFHLGLQTGAPLVPIVAEPYAHLVDFKTKQLNPGVVRVRILDPIESAPFAPDDVDGLSERVRGEMLECVESFEKDRAETL